jgi:hypothetical protein
VRGTGSWGVGCCSWVCDAVDAGGALKQVQQQHQQQQQHDAGSSDITRTFSGGSSEDCSARSSPPKNCVFACIAPGSISGVAAADVLRCLPAQWRALGLGTAAAVSDNGSGSGGTTYLGAGQRVQLLLEKLLMALKRACADVGGGGAGEAVIMTHGVVVMVLDDVGLSARATMQMAGNAMQAAALAVGDESLSVVVQPFFTSVLVRGGGGCHLDAAASLAVQIYNKILAINDKPSPLIPRLDDHQLARCDTVTLFSAARVGGSR